MMNPFLSHLHIFIAHYNIILFLIIYLILVTNIIYVDKLNFYFLTVIKDSHQISELFDFSNVNYIHIDFSVLPNPGRNFHLQIFHASRNGYFKTQFAKTISRNRLK